LGRLPNSSSNLVASVEASSGKILGSKSINDGLWHHLAIVVADHNLNGTNDIAEAKIYIDGILDPSSSTTSTSVATTSNSPVSIGGSSTAGSIHYRGRLDDVRIFPRALDLTEIQLIYQQPSNQTSELLTLDSDKDGITDELELMAGTDPDDSTSTFKIQSFETTENGISLQWSAVAGRTYRVEESSNLTTWTSVPGIAPMVITSTQPNASVVVSANSAARRFLRIQVALTP
jgi:hypothetical protein